MLILLCIPYIGYILVIYFYLLGGFTCINYFFYKEYTHGVQINELYVIFKMDLFYFLLLVVSIFIIGVAVILRKKKFFSLKFVNTNIKNYKLYKMTRLTVNPAFIGKNAINEGQFKFSEKSKKNEDGVWKKV